MIQKLQKNVGGKLLLNSPHLLEGQSGFISILIAEIIIHPKIRLSAKLVPGLAVWDALDHATLRERQSVNKYLIRTLKS